MWSLGLLLGLPILAGLAGWYKFQAWRWDLAALGLGLAAASCLFARLPARLAPGLAPALVWGTLLGGAAWGLLLALLAPFTGLTWVLVAPFHQEALFVALCLAAFTALVRGPWAGRWPRPGPGRSLPGAVRLLVGVGFCALLVLVALYLGLQASLLETGGAGGAGGLKGLAKSPAAVHWLLALAGLGLAAALGRWPGPALTRWLPGVGFGLMWARVGLSLVSAMEPVQRAFSNEILQLLFLAAAVWLGLRLASPGAEPSPPGPGPCA